MERRVAGEQWDPRIPDLVFTTTTGAPIVVSVDNFTAKTTN